MTVRHHMCATLAVLWVAVAIAQQPVVDTIAAANGNISIRPIAHATLQLVHGDTIILVDPALDGALPPPPTPPGAPTPPPAPPPLPGTLRTSRYQGLSKPTLILVTDLDEDHFSIEAVTHVKTATTRIVGPTGIGRRIPTAMTLMNGETRTVDGVTIEAVPMYNVRRGPRPGEVFHKKGRGNGYVLTVAGKRLYIAGDTECTAEMRALKSIDVAFLPMNLPLTMTPDEAAECAKAFRPAVAYPYHYAGQDTRLFDAALKGTGIEVRLRNWYPLIRQ